MMNQVSAWNRDREFYLDQLKRWRGSLILLPLCIYYVINRGEYTLLDNADLIIHEAGHFFFRPFGRFLTYAGGTTMQLLLPSILVWHFMRHEFRFGVQVSLFWLGHNLINISVYAADARSRRLPLLGGDIYSHDWWNMLGMVGLLPYDQIFGHAFMMLAVVAFGMLVLLPLKMGIDGEPGRRSRWPCGQCLARGVYE